MVYGYLIYHISLPDPSIMIESGGITKYTVDIVLFDYVPITPDLHQRKDIYLF